jgi:signal transduction histidine kinase
LSHFTPEQLDAERTDGPVGEHRPHPDGSAAGEPSDLLDAIAAMAAGAAHELNNPLTVIAGRAQLMKEKSTDPADRRTWELIDQQANRISDIISDLMAFSSPAPPTPEAIDPLELFNSTISFFSSANHPNASHARFDKEVDTSHVLWGDRAQIHAAMVKLVDNALHAARTRPDIRLRATAAEDDQLLLQVIDRGVGMDAQTLQKAFTPFFSAQRAGRRRGLGLPLAWRYVVNNHGRLWIESQVAVGTTANILLAARRGNH